MKFVAIIPARYNSSRFPGKPLAKIAGLPMIQYVYTTVSSVKKIDEVYVATDDKRIYDSVIQFGGKAVMTGDFPCGTDRVEWVSRFVECDVVINVQGDEPLIKGEMIDLLISAFDDESVTMATLKKEITSEDELNNPNIVKVITDKNDNAIYFSRYPIPYNRDKKCGYKKYKHIGIYAYKKDFLKNIISMQQTQLELSESLEQLRVIENGYSIRVLESKFETIGVDTPEQILEIERLLKSEVIV